MCERLCLTLSAGAPWPRVCHAQVLHPYIGRVKQLMYLKDDVVAKFCQNLQLLVRSGAAALRRPGAACGGRGATRAVNASRFSAQVRVEKQKKADPSTIPCEGLMMQARTLGPGEALGGRVGSRGREAHAHV